MAVFRRFDPGPGQTIPAGPFKTMPPCDLIVDDFTKLSLAVDDLKNLLRQRPSNPGAVKNRSDVVKVSLWENHKSLEKEVLRAARLYARRY